MPPHSTCHPFLSTNLEKLCPVSREHFAGPTKHQLILLFCRPDDSVPQLEDVLDLKVSIM